MGQQPALDCRRLVRGDIVEHQVHVEVSGHGLIDRDQELSNSIGQWRACSEPITLPLAISTAA
jgi:hypothetical protein